MTAGSWDPDNPEHVARLRDRLRKAGAPELAAALSGHALRFPRDDPHRVARLLDGLRKAGLHEQAAALADRAAAHTPLNDPDAAARLLDSLREAGGRDQAAVLADRAAARPVPTASARAESFGDGWGGKTLPQWKRAAEALRKRAEEKAERQAKPGRFPTARPRYLVGQCPDSVAVGKPFSLLASINMAASPTSAELGLIDVPPEGQDVVLVMHAPGLHVLSDHQQTVHVPADGDSRPVRFELRADTPGPAKVSITAWIGGTHLGELQVEVTTERDRVPGRRREVVAEITTQPTAGP